MQLREVESSLRYEQNSEFRAGIDRLFNRITNPVEEFAARTGLGINKWYQDAPVWILNWTKADNLQRIIQIGVALGELDTPTLTFISYAYVNRSVVPARRDFSTKTMTGYIDDVLLNETPDLPGVLLLDSFNTANYIKAVSD